MSEIERLYSPPEIGAVGRRNARRRRRDLVLAGLFVLAMGLVLLAGIGALLGGGGAYRLYASFDEAPDLRPGSPVEQAGQVIGRVTVVRPVFEVRSMVPRFHLTLRIRSDWRLPADSQARIAAAGPLQGNLVRILPGRSERPLADGEHIDSGGVEPDLMVRLDELSGYIHTLIDETVRPMLASLNRQVHALEGVLASGDEETTGQNLSNLAQILENLRQASEALGQHIAAVDTGGIGRIVDSAGDAVGHLDALVQTFQARAGELERLMAEYRGVGARLNRLIEHNRPAIDRSVTETEYLLQELSTTTGPILDNVDGATRNLLELSRDLRDNPALILGGREQPDNSPPSEGGR